jgi:putative transposase
MNARQNKVEHRKKVKHYDLDSEAHFLTFSCYHRLPLLGKDRTRRWLIEALADARTKHNFHLWGWVIMPEHVHLLIWSRVAGTRTKDILADIKRPVGQKAIAWLEEHRPEFLERLTVRNRKRTYRHFWQVGPGQDHNVYTPEVAHRILEYIHFNPVRRGLVLRPEDWLWSSARDWAGRDDVLIRVDRTLPMVLEIPHEM